MVIGGATETSIGPMPDNVENLKTINFLTDSVEPSTLLELTQKVADKSFDVPSVVASSSIIDVISSIGANVEVAIPPVRRRQPRHGLGNLDSVDVSDGRKFRDNVSREPAKCVDKALKDLHIERVRSSLARGVIHGKWAEQARLKRERVELAKMASEMPSSDVVIILTRARASGMPVAEAPLLEHLALSSDDVIGTANDATRFWGGTVAIGRYHHDIDTVIQRFQLGADHAEMAFYSAQDASNYLNLLPSDFTSLADAILAEREVETRVNVRKAQAVNRLIAKIRKTRK